ncbi:MAG: hypothetical protein M0P64_03495 [Candidatus Pacebacteria bacterium]|jgi:hypothetical protein|nr:hypothetical protein [Candidatus Paceibacterota bacterium]
MLKKDWKKELKKLTFSRGKDSLRMELTPFRDWRIIVVTFFLSLFLSVGFNIYISSEANRDAFFSAEAKQTVGVIKFNQDALAKVIKEIDDKATRYEKVKTEQMLLIDPSL